jgi:predicted nucleic acid-binding protein
MRLYVDSNVVIKAVEGTGEVQAFCAALLKPKIEVITSELTLAETLVGPLKKHGETLQDTIASNYQALLIDADKFKVLPVSRERLIAAAELRAQRPSLKLPDAIHVATASLANCTHFISGDRRLLAVLGAHLEPLDIESRSGRAAIEEALR